MSVFLSTVLFLLAALLYTAAFLCEQLADLARSLELEITLEFLFIVEVLIFRGNWGALAIVLTINVITFLEVGRQGAIGLGLPWNISGSL